MTNLNNEISDFLEDHESPYTNKNGVEIDMSSGDVVMACCNVPGFVKQGKYQLEYLFNYESIKSFINKFSITRLADMEEINPKQVDILFHQGEVELWCHIYPTEDYLVFKKKENNFLVIDDEMTHVLDAALSEFEDFHKYTRYYYSEG